MKKTMISLKFAAIAALSLVAQAVAAEQQVIKAGHVLDVATGELKKSQYILVDDSKIVSITDKNPAPNAKQIDLSDQYLLPGLMDMHTHVVRHLSKSFYDGYFSHHTARQ